MKATIRLFNALPIETKRKKSDTELLKKTLLKGFVFSPEVIYNYPDHNKLIASVEKIIGLSGEKLNNSFHKSWAKVKNASIEQLVLEQMVHYFTTYGFEALGIYDKNSVYIPNEELELPEDIDGIELTVINGYTKKELKTKLLKLLSSGIALHEDTVKDVLEVAEFVGINEKDLESIKNKEVRIALYDSLDIFPEDPTEFLRFTIYKAIEKTLLIKSPALIAEIREAESVVTINKLFKKYENKHGLNRLAEIFYRFKPIFLAFRKNSELKTRINRVRKLAEKYHKSLPEDYLNSITSKLKNGEKIINKKLNEELSSVNIFRKIRLAYALKFRTKEVDSILYKIRNGKGYATDFKFSNKEPAKKVLEIVLKSIIEDISKNVKGKKVFIPENIKYSLPATEKQFTGSFPSGTYVTIPKDMIFGIHWENVPDHRIDLDLSVISPNTGKIGWDSDYRTDSGNILFSGDITDAPNPKGAMELFYVKRQKKNSLILFVNYYNYDKEIEVPFKIIVAKEEAKGFGKNYMVNPNNVIAVASTKINEQQKVLGLMVSTSVGSRFYFTESSVGKSISSSGSDFVENTRKYLFGFYENTIELEDILIKAGAKIIKDKNKCDIDLSPEDLQKDSILNLLYKNDRR